MKKVIKTMKRIIEDPFNYVAIIIGIVGVIGMIAEPTSAAGWTGMICASAFTITLSVIEEIITDFDD